MMDYFRLGLLWVKEYPHGYKISPAGLEPPVGARNRRKVLSKYEETRKLNSTQDP